MGTLLNRFAKAALSSLGFEVCRHGNQPRGVDWLLDLTRHVRHDGRRAFLDVGANIGQTSLALVRRFPDAQIHAFEPVSSTFETLRGATRAHANIKCHRLGLSDHPGSIEFDAVPGSVYNSVARCGHAAQGRPCECAPVTTVDEFTRKLGVDRIDLLKTDTEGHDLNVLKGACSALTHGLIRAVFTEVTFCRGNTHNTLFPLVQEFLEPLGYRFVGLYDMHYFQTKRWSETFCNALFVRDDDLAPASRAQQRKLRQAMNMTEGMGVEA